MPELEPRKTGGLTALGVLSVVFGALFLLGAVWGLLQPATQRALVEQSGAPQLVTEGTAKLLYLDAFVNVPLALLLFVAGIGLLQLRTWGAKLANGYAVARITWSAVAFVMALAGPYANRPGPDRLQGLVQTFADFMRTRFGAIALIEAVAALVISSVFAVILLCLLSRKSYRENLS